MRPPPGRATLIPMELERPFPLAVVAGIALLGAVVYGVFAALALLWG